MFRIAKPTEESINRFIAEQKGKPFSYSEVGASRNGNVPDRYTIDHNRIQLGKGRASFERAIETVRRWKMFDLSFTKICFDDTPIEVGRTVAILIKHFGFWSLNATRIVYVLDEIDNEIESSVLLTAH